MKKVLGIIVTILIVAGIVFIFFFGKGSGFGIGAKDGEGDGENTEQEVNVDEETENRDEVEADNEAAEQNTVLIEVKQSQYLINGEEKTLSEIESLLSDENVGNTIFILEDNYASTKAWDEIKKLFTGYEISVIEQ